MTGFKLVVLTAVAGCFLMVAAPKATAQIAVEIGLLPIAPMATMTPLLMAVLPTATTARNGLRAVSSLALALGFMAMTTSKAT